MSTQRPTARHSKNASRIPGLTAQLLAILALAATVSGCGYTLVGRASNLPEDIQAVFVEPMTNSTSRPQVEQFLTQAVSDELLTRRRFTLVNSVAEADAILRGNVISFNLRPINFGTQGLARNFEITVTVDMRFQRPPLEGPEEDQGEVVWSNSRYIFREDYEVEDANQVFFDRQNVAIEEVAVRFAETMVTDLLEGF